MKLVLCGPPATGKTTVTEHLRDRLREAGREVEVLHSDDFSRNTYEQLYERVTEPDPDDDSIADPNADSTTDLSADWILDGTFYRRTYQDRFRALPDAHLVYLTASLETALERNRERADAIDERGLRVMHAKFEVPENPDLTLDTDRLSVEEAVTAVTRYVEAWIDAKGRAEE